MGCFVLLGAFISARLAVFLTWIFTDRMTIAFESGWIGVFGFCFLPWTTLAWAWSYQPIFGVQGFGWFVVAFAFIADIASYGQGAQTQRRRSSSYS